MMVAEVATKTLDDVLREHQIVGTSGYGIEDVMCSCQHDGWTGRGTWHPRAWYPKHLAKHIRKAFKIAPKGTK